MATLVLLFCFGFLRRCSLFVFHQTFACMHFSKKTKAFSSLASQNISFPGGFFGFLVSGSPQIMVLLRFSLVFQGLGPGINGFAQVFFVLSRPGV